MLSNGDNIGASHLGDGDTAVGFVGGIEVDVVRANTSSDGELELLRLLETLLGEVAWVETVVCSSAADAPSGEHWIRHIRCGDDDFSVNKFLVELGVGVVLVGGSDESVASILEPFADSKLVLSGAL